MTNRADLWALLTGRIGEWIDRDNINFVGGGDAGRRMREIREDIARSGQYRLDERRGADGSYEYRLTEISDAPIQTERFKWRCTVCGEHPVDYMQTAATMDPRYRMGQCVICKRKATQSIFKRTDA